LDQNGKGIRVHLNNRVIEGLVKNMSISGLVYLMSIIIGNNLDTMKSWLMTPNKSLGDRSPMEILRKEENGVEILTALLVKIEWGIPISCIQKGSKRK